MRKRILCLAGCTVFAFFATLVGSCGDGIIQPGSDCLPDCGVRVCGPVPNGCGERCGSCADPESCDISSGQCNACAPVCSPAGSTKCLDGKISSCLTDGAGCLDWGTWVSCATGTCADAYFCDDCSNACPSALETRCEAGQLSNCEPDAQGCLNWGTAIPCESGSCQDAKQCKDQVIVINGRRVFPVYTYSVCYYGKCDISTNTEFTFSLDYNTNSLPPMDDYQSAGMWVVVNAYGKSLSGFSSLIDHPAFLGWSNKDEPPDSEEAAIAAHYKAVKAFDPAHPVFMNHWHDLVKWEQYGDIITWDNYPKRKIEPYFPNEIIYGWEFHSNTRGITKVTKPLWAVLQGQGKTDGAGTIPMTPQEIRANTYTAITMNVKGLGYWPYSFVSGSAGGEIGLKADPALHTYYRQLAKELTALNDVLISPSVDYSWEYRRSTGVSFDKTLSAVVYGKTMTNFNYMLKKYGGKMYLFVVNKDRRPIANVKISVSFLAGTGKKTARTIGLETSGSQAKDRTIELIDGAFSDAFDGYAAHIYEIASGSLLTAGNSFSSACPEEENQ